MVTHMDKHTLYSIHHFPLLQTTYILTPCMTSTTWLVNQKIIIRFKPISVVVTLMVLFGIFRIAFSYILYKSHCDWLLKWVYHVISQLQILSDRKAIPRELKRSKWKCHLTRGKKHWTTHESIYACFDQFVKMLPPTNTSSCSQLTLITVHNFGTTSALYFSHTQYLLVHAAPFNLPLMLRHGQLCYRRSWSLSLSQILTPSRH